MSTHPLEGLMSTTLENIREMVDVNTVVGDPISSLDGSIIIPVSRVSFGFGSGGSDLPTKQPKEVFGGASGAGISIHPIAFLVINQGEVKLLQLSTTDNTVDNIINRAPDIIQKISDLFQKDSAHEAGSGSCKKKKNRFDHRGGHGHHHAAEEGTDSADAAFADVAPGFPPEMAK